MPGFDKRLKLFVNEEPFYSTPPDRWNQNRVFVGAQLAPVEAVTAAIAWGVQSVRRGRDWEDRQILSLFARVAF